jgi:hypothetical protein
MMRKSKYILRKNPKKKDFGLTNLASPLLCIDSRGEEVGERI